MTRRPARALALYVGTSGWAYPEWRGSFYPDGLPQSRFLEHYGATLGACEVNATFYRAQPAAALARWAASVPDGFRFAVKAHRRLTHRRRLEPDAGTAAFADEFLASLRPLGRKLACLLLQVPEHLERDDRALEGLLDLLPPGTAFACELRHPSWNAAQVAGRLAERGGTLCLREIAGTAQARLPPGQLAYVRLKADRYEDPAALRAALEREAAERDVYAFARHKGVPADDPHTGVGLAAELVRDR